jgi:hypothetical protein
MDASSEGALVVRYECFKATLATWDDLFSEAAEFATQVGRDRLIGISHSADKSTGVITVWYWGEPDSRSG